MNIYIAVFGAIAAILVALFLLNPTIPQIQSGFSNDSVNLPNLGKAPELRGIHSWINSEPLRIEDLKGKVVMVDFWTYSCINCIRTIPYINDWHEKYSDKGLVILGVHTPEFEFEKDYNNVKKAVDNYGIKYPVAQDNDYSTWRAYRNNYWPRKYVIDKEGNIRYDHIGEGAYEETERVIQLLLNEKSNMTEVKSDTDFSKIETPELYFGYGFARAALGNDEGFQPEKTVDYREKMTVIPNVIYLSGSWTNKEDRMISVNNSALSLMYKAKNVNIVAGGNTKIKIFLDDEIPSSNYLGEDVTLEDGEATVQIDGHRLYNIISSPDYERHVLKIQADSGFEIYTFTFG